MIQGLNILVVDSNPYMRRLTRLMLDQPWRRTVFQAVYGLVALETIRTCDSDVMLLDWDMPILDGMEVIRIGARRACPAADLPIIMLSDRGQRLA